MWIHIGDTERGTSMKQGTFNTFSIDEEAQGAALQSSPTEQSLPISLRAAEACDVLSVSMLAHHCLREIDNYRRGELYTDAYGLELLRRAIVQGDQEAWAWIQHCFSGLVHGWLRRHPKREVACRLESEENYVDQAFERFDLADDRVGTLVDERLCGGRCVRLP